MPRFADLLIILAVLCVPVLMLHGFAYASGWTKLAKAYPLPNPKPHDGKWIRFRSAQVGKHLLGGINNGLHILVHEDGLRFSVFIVGFAYRSFFVPWQEIEMTDRSKGRVRLVFARVPNVPLKISPKTFDRIMSLAPAE